MCLFAESRYEPLSMRGEKNFGTERNNLEEIN